MIDVDSPRVTEDRIAKLEQENERVLAEREALEEQNWRRMMGDLQNKAMELRRALPDDYQEHLDDVLHPMFESIEELEAEKARIRLAFCLFWKAKGCTCCEDTESLEAHGRELAELLDIPIYDDDSGVDYWSVCEALDKDDVD